jgi:RNA polymerase sigma-70 factor (ECF subfamily)
MRPAFSHPVHPDEFTNDLRAARSGSNDALGRVLDRFRAYLLRIANDELDSDLRPKVGSSDLVQQSLLEAHQSFLAFRGAGPDDFLGWLRTILRHNLADARSVYHESAKRQLRLEVRLDAADTGPVRNKLVGPSGSPLERMVVDEESRIVQQAIDRLREDHRRVLTLRHQERRSFVQIGAALDRSEEAARKLWFRAIESLRDELRRSP